ncbi:LysR family transcriptional regulator [Vibrio mimicus]|uniref:LysR substrate-binding domain-containing protein n=1 Tax=Vibrio mimicus TaxID=674 RepID=UPI0002BC52E4|nr:LysR substrate-binding domain-containing protein [Vibrio mimicus]EMB51869.1 LysR family transcriptional regulator [Vibrio mimicus CAIM 602]MBY7675669.1 LysR family transcriptional regulator [Vibrio mimicus]MBY7727444.1 LysR family transcriptional regulator [Vibrio mimicus]TXY30961.1 LysR family transcriptional regulator [Vibrio mimicus]SUQ23100.1 LysR family transcriptional regulator [Vibrio mimicus]
MRKLAPLKSLYSFVAVAETGSMTLAAEALNVSHSAISQAIKSLETQLDQPLFHRVGRQVILNSAGKRYYQKVAPALEQIVEATESLLKPTYSNRITLNMINSLALHWWIPRVSSFQAFAPEVDVRISTLTGTFSLADQSVDVALIHGQLRDWQDYYCEKLAEDELVMVASRAMVSSEISAQQALAQLPAIFASNPRRQNDWEIWCQANQVNPPKQQRNLSFAASAQALQATLSGLGVFVTHRLFVKQEVESGILKEIGNTVIHPDQGYYFACTADKLRSEAVLKLRKWLSSEFQQEVKATQSGRYFSSKSD